MDRNVFRDHLVRLSGEGFTLARISLWITQIEATTENDRRDCFAGVL